MYVNTAIVTIWVYFLYQHLTTLVVKNVSLVTVKGLRHEGLQL